jgi:ADP-ribose pyrophosphatase
MFELNIQYLINLFKFMEEATDALGQNASKRNEIDQHLNEFFENGVEIYKGYVDDPRNTDNAWMETTAYNFHDEDDSVFKNFTLSAGNIYLILDYFNRD